VKHFTESEASHVVILRNEQPETDTPSLWLGIVRTDDESDSRVILCESKHGNRVSEQAFTSEEWTILRRAIIGGVL